MLVYPDLFNFLETPQSLHLYIRLVASSESTLVQKSVSESLLSFCFWDDIRKQIDGCEWMRHAHQGQPAAVRHRAASLFSPS